jgi:hypothetical protein
MMTSNNSNKHIQVCCRIRSASCHACSVEKNINNSEASNYDNVNINISSNCDDIINCVHKRVQSLSDFAFNDPYDADDFNGHESGSTRYASSAIAVYEVVTTNGIYQMDYVFDRDDTQVGIVLDHQDQHQHHRDHYHNQLVIIIIISKLSLS